LKLFINLLRKFIEDRNRLLPERAADSATCMGLCARMCSAQQASLNNACRRTVCKWICKFEPPRYHVWGACTKPFWKLHPKPNIVS